MRGLLLLMCLSLGGLAWALSTSPVDGSKSRITATFTQMNVAVDGEFKRIKGQVSYDPAKPESSSTELSIDTASFDIGDEDYNAEVRKAEWFDSNKYPLATFKSTAVRPLGPNQFEATGTLLLKGKAVTVKAPVTVKTEGALRRFEGQLPISRKTFKLGDAGWDEVLEDQVLVKFVIVAPAS